MNKGIGALQARILSELSTAGRWLFVADLAERVAPDGGRSARVSVGRAVAGLARRELVKCGEFRSVDYGKENLSATVWLPGQPSPFSRAWMEPLATIRGEAIERAILDALRSRAAQGFIVSDYETVVNEVRHRMRCYENRLYVAAARAVKRLEARGEIEATRGMCGNRRKLRSLRLASVAR